MESGSTTFGTALEGCAGFVGKLFKEKLWKSRKNL
jgi:hypothetical protein